MKNLCNNIWIIYMTKFKNKNDTFFAKVNY